MILLIDNYDSFVYNLFQLAGSIDPDILVVRNDALAAEDIRTLNPTHIILSPGPGRPKDAGICEKVVRLWSKTYPILGICLGHQAICEAYGAKIDYSRKLMHGKKSQIRIDVNALIFKGLPEYIEGARYHSLIADKESIPERLLVIGEDGSGEVMAVMHKTDDVYGLQFHPESILTPMGHVIIRNFLSKRRGVS
ncbi:MAG: aminodeoxychorismate/anthranilate synthase component II [Clostridiaceae bacterium]|jgi:anthranilate synthase component 2|nr:aminodeoxychorismate/anthranilate synthase component II [Clostridiaceae bacterium]